jgi:hypothetical protein
MAPLWLAESASIKQEAARFRKFRRRLDREVDIAGTVAAAVKDDKLWTSSRESMLVRVNDHCRHVDKLVV